MVGADVHHQIVIITITAVVVDVEYPGVLNIVCWSLAYRLLLHGKTLRITCVKQATFVSPKFSVMVVVRKGLWIILTMKI
jgi:hypothetical protein